MTILSSAKEVLYTEAKAIEIMAEALDSELGKIFEEAIKAILNVKGRVVVTGMGKSGHIAKKIAATMASTGTPAFFVHPAEASHGDMGMITTDDIVIGISKSGNTAELAGVLTYCTRYALPLIAITENKDSELAKHAKFPLIVPNKAEACPLGAAPTTSTTLALALGDAIAITLLSERGFTAENFNVYHPGGHLGKKLMIVREIMHKDSEIPLTHENINMSEAIILMTKYSFGCLGIVENGSLSGLITDGDLRRNMDNDFLSKKVKDIMHKAPITIESNTPVGAALQIMNSKQITSLFVVEENKPVGIVHIHDCLRAGVQ